VLDVSLRAAVMTRGSGILPPPPLGACLDANEASSAGLAIFEGRVEEAGLGMPDPAGTEGCPDAFADRIQVAVWARNAQVRDNGGIGGPCYAARPIEQAEGAPQYLCLSDGTLSRQCAASTPCPGDSRCAEGLCRPSSSTN